ncbi:unnamed protein product [Prunus armeniaca]
MGCSPDSPLCGSVPGHKPGVARGGGLRAFVLPLQANVHGSNIVSSMPASAVRVVDDHEIEESDMVVCVLNFTSSNDLGQVRNHFSTTGSLALVTRLLVLCRARWGYAWWSSDLSSPL